MEVGAGACPPAPGRACSFKYIGKRKDQRPDLFREKGTYH